MEPPDFLPPDPKLLATLKDLKPDNIRQSLDILDWRSAASLCHVFPVACRQNYWKSRAEREFPDQEWIVAYKYDFHGYLAMRSRSLIKYKDVPGFVSPLKARFKSVDLGIDLERIPSRRTPLAKHREVPYTAMELRNFLHTINDREEINGYNKVTFNVLTRPYLVGLLKNYFNPNPVEDQLKKIELYTISRFLAKYLKANYPKNFTRKTIQLTPDQALRYFDQTEEVLNAPPGTRISPHFGVWSEEKSSRFAEEFSILPDNLVTLLKGVNHTPSRFRRLNTAGNLFLNQDGLIDWADEAHMNFLIEEMIARLKTLGIVREHFSLLY